MKHGNKYVGERDLLIKNQRGLVYLTALAVMMMLAGFGLSSLYVARTEMTVSGNELRTLRNFYLAEAAVEHSMADLLYASGGTGNVGYSQIPNPGGEILAYEAYCDLGNNTIVGKGRAGSSQRDIQVKINRSGFTNAMAIENEISFSSTFAPGSRVINGNMELSNTVSEGSWAIFLANVNINGRVDKGAVPNSKIPTPDFAQYQSEAQSGGTYYNTTQEWTKDTVFSDPNAIHYIDGDLYIVGPGPIDIKGTVVVKGKITIGKNEAGVNKLLYNTRLTFTPALHKPAVIVGKTTPTTGGDMVMTASVPSLLDLQFDGLVYTESRISIQSFKTLTINGALVCKSPSAMATLMQSSESGSNLAINYDPDIDPGAGYFTGGNVGKPVIVSWQGHTQ